VQLLSTLLLRFYGSDLSCFNVYAPTCPRDTIICLPDDKMAPAEAGRFASLSGEDFEFNLVDQFFKLVRIVVKACLCNWISMCKIVILSAFNFI
jgi:hypothetical protein